MAYSARRPLIVQPVEELLSYGERVVGWLHELGRCHSVQGAREPLVRTRAVCARSQMTLDVHEPRPVFAVIVQDEIVVADVNHRPLPCAASARRIFRTARKMCCLAALLPMPSVCAISLIEHPSKWRS